MKLPSLNHILDSTANTVFRFPFETLCAIVATSMGHMGIQEIGEENVLAKIAMCAALGLVVFLSSSLFFDTSTRWASKRFVVQPVLLLLLVGYYFTFSEKPKEIELQLFVVTNICFHLAVSFAAFIRNGQSVEAFWEFNKRLFLRFLTAGLYSGVLFGGLSLAIAAVDNLFDLQVDGLIFGQLFVTIAGIFNTLFFLSGVPKVQSDNLEIDYPKGLKAFTQFVLLPLVTLYLLILVVYEGKIVFTMSLPYGWVSILILVYSIFGILSFLLIFPIRNLEGNAWIQTFNKWFYYFLLLLLGLLYWAILYRIHHYGFTPERYYVLVLAVWLTLIVVYFLVNKSQNIKLIPMSLCITGLLTVYGPQSALSVSRGSQLNRYKHYLEQNKTAKLSEEDQRELSSVVNYIINYHNPELLIEHADNQLDTVQSITRGNVMASLGLKYYSPKHNTEEDYIYLTSPSSDIHLVSGYDVALDFNSYGTVSCDSCVLLNNQYYPVSTHPKEGILTLTIAEHEIVLDVNRFVNSKQIINGHDYTRDELTMVVEENGYRIKVMFSNITVVNQTETYKVTSYAGTICIGVKR